VRTREVKKEEEKRGKGLELEQMRRKEIKIEE
jgi:hypothetical protein